MGHALRDGLLTVLLLGLTLNIAAAIEAAWEWIKGHASDR